MRTSCYCCWCAFAQQRAALSISWGTCVVLPLLSFILLLLLLLSVPVLLLLRWRRLLLLHIAPLLLLQQVLEGRLRR
jgi:hypothetical protein